jgi:hypothetical protein
VKRLLTYGQAKKFSGLGEKFPACEMKAMDAIVQVVMREKIGQTLYDKMLALVRDCNSDPLFFGSSACAKLYNKLWCDHLAQYLALHVEIQVAGESVADITGAGVVVKLGPDHAPASSAVIDRMFAAKDTLIAAVKNNMTYFIRQNNTTGCFDGYLELGNCCETCYRLLTVDCTCEQVCAPDADYNRGHYTAP